MPLENGNVMWSCCLIKGLEKPFSESIDYVKQKKSKKVETAVHVSLIPAPGDMVLRMPREMVTPWGQCKV